MVSGELVSGVDCKLIYLLWQALPLSLGILKLLIGVSTHRVPHALPSDESEILRAVVGNSECHASKRVDFLLLWQPVDSEAIGLRRVEVYQPTAEVVLRDRTLLVPDSEIEVRLLKGFCGIAKVL